jgi:hypothetical protein
VLERPGSGKHDARRRRREKNRGQYMDTGEIRKYLHDLSNALNAAKINAYLLRRMHGDLLDKETAEGLDSSLYDAEKLVGEFHRRVHEEMVEPEKTAS